MKIVLNLPHCTRFSTLASQRSLKKAFGCQPICPAPAAIAFASVFAAIVAVYRWGILKRSSLVTAGTRLKARKRAGCCGISRATVKETLRRKAAASAACLLAIQSPFSCLSRICVQSCFAKSQSGLHEGPYRRLHYRVDLGFRRAAGAGVEPSPAARANHSQSRCFGMAADQARRHCRILPRTIESASNFRTP